MIFYIRLIFSRNPVGQEEKTQLCGVSSCYSYRLPKQPTEYPSPAVRACVSCANAQGGGGYAVGCVAG